MSGGAGGAGGGSGGSAGGASGGGYHSSKSINTAPTSSGGGYSATRGGSRPFNPGQPNAQAAGNKQQHSPKQGNVSKKQQDDKNNQDNGGLTKEQQMKKQAAKVAVVEAAKAYNPVVGKVVEKAVETRKGEEYLDEFAKAPTVEKGVIKVLKKADKDQKKTKMIITLVAILAPILLFIIIVCGIFGSSADTNIYSNDNDGEVDHIEEGIESTVENNVFENYPGMYEKVEETVKKETKDKKVQIDRYLILATLIAPIENGLIQPIEGDCGSEDGLCYRYKDEDGNLHLYSFEKFIEVWSKQAELLARMQILTYVDIDSGNHTPVNNTRTFECGDSSHQNMEQFAKNDNQKNKFNWWNIFLPWTWDDNYYSTAADAELNARCIEAKVGSSRIPDVRVLSIDEGDYYAKPLEEGQEIIETEYDKDPDSGGVYFWNLVNQYGFIDSYLQEYLAYDTSSGADPDLNYKKNLPKILETAHYIYSYYEGIRRDCLDYEVLKAEIEKIDFQEDGSSPRYTLDFEDAFVGGSVLATFGGATGEVAKAQAILTRSEAYNAIVEQGMDVIIGSAKMGCWWWKYNPTYDPSYENQEDNPNYDPDYPKEHFPEIYKAVKETEGIVVTELNGFHVQETQYDAFCPTTHDPIDGFYYLPDGQNNLPIDDSRFNASEFFKECPCFQNKGSRPEDQFVQQESEIWPKHLGTPSQDTTDRCWEPTGETKQDDDGNTLFGYEYSPTGGHGEGASQHGMAYFSQYGYKWDGIIGLFFDNIAYRKLDTKCIKPDECNHALIWDRNGNKII